MNIWKAAASVVICLAIVIATMPVSAQIRGGRRTAVVRGEEGKGAAVGPRGAAVKTEDGYGACGRRGAVVKGEEGYAAVGRRGAVVKGEDGYAAVGRHGAVVSGEDGYAAVGRRGVVVGNHYDSYEAWRVAAGVGAVI